MPRRLSGFKSPGNQWHDENNHDNCFHGTYKAARHDKSYETPYFMRVCYNYQPKHESLPFNAADVDPNEFIDSIKNHRDIKQIPTFLASTRGCAILCHMFSYVHPNLSIASYFFDLVALFQSTSSLWIGTTKLLMDRIVSTMWNNRSHASFIYLLKTTHNHKNRIGMHPEKVALLSFFLIRYYHANTQQHSYVSDAIPFLHYQLHNCEVHSQLLKELCNTFYFIDINVAVAVTQEHSEECQLDFRQLSVFPDVQQVILKNKTISRYHEYSGVKTARRSMILYKHFHLLHEDMIAPLSEELQGVLTHPQREKLLEEYAFLAPYATELQLQDYGPLSSSIIITMNTSLALRSKVKNMNPILRSKYCEDGDRLILAPESVLLFLDGEKLQAMGIIADKVIKLSNNCLHVSVGVKFFGDGLEFVLSRLTNVTTDLEQKQLSQYVIQAKTSFFSHLPFLERIQKLIGSDDMKFEDEIVDSSPPVEDSILETKGIPIPFAVKNILKDDERQYQAARDALSQKLTIIQGPPGTGKTFVGVQIVKSILQQTKHRILVMCYTNHALDSFLESILRESSGNGQDCVIAPSSIVRFGSKVKTSDVILENFFASLNSTSSPFAEDERRLWDDLFAEKVELENTINILREKIMRTKMFDDSQMSYEEFSKYCHTNKKFASLLQQFTVPCTCSLENIHYMTRSATKKSRSSSRGNSTHSEVCSLYKLKPCDYWQMWHHGRTQPYDIRVNTGDDREESMLSVDMGTDVENRNNISTYVSDENLWLLPMEKRHEKLQYWYFSLVEQTTKELADVIKKRDKLVSLMNDLSKQSCNDFANLRIIACTTTFAARNHTFLNDMNVAIGVIEEAAEILEAQLIATIPATVKQLIMIGDHQQLKPKLQYYPLRNESHQGINFDQSMFERLVIHANYPKVTLNIQHRMRPEISSFVRLLTYPFLIDSQRVLNRDNIRGVKSNIIFVNHNYLEVNEITMSKMSEEDGRSKTPHILSDPRKGLPFQNSFTKSNPYEANMAIEIFKYFLQQGYKAEDITILTPYLGQLQLLKKIIEENGDYISELNDLDRTEVGDQFIDRSADIRTYFSDMTDDKIKIRIATIDNFQGEEAKIIIACLVRSNMNGDIGFLSRPERINVLFSRARDGFIILGNTNTFLNCTNKEGRKYWSQLMSELENRRCIFDGFPTVCSSHRKDQLIATAEDFGKLVPHGGCREVCGEVIGTCPFSHRCQKYCHPIPLLNAGITRCSPCTYHSQMKCMMPTMMKCPRQHHSVIKYCHSRLREKCHAIIDVTCSKGHTFAAKCSVFDVDKTCAECCENNMGRERNDIREEPTTSFGKKKRNFDDTMDHCYTQDFENEVEVEDRRKQNKRFRNNDGNGITSPSRSGHREVQVITGKSWKSPQPSFMKASHFMSPSPAQRNLHVNTSLTSGKNTNVLMNSLLSPFAFREEFRLTNNIVENAQTPTRKKLIFNENGGIRDTITLPHSSTGSILFSSPSRSTSRTVEITSPIVWSKATRTDPTSRDYDETFSIVALPSYNYFISLLLPQGMQELVLNYIVESKTSRYPRDIGLHICLFISQQIVAEEICRAIHQLLIESSLVDNIQPIHSDGSENLGNHSLVTRKFIIVDRAEILIGTSTMSHLSQHVVITSVKSKISSGSHQSEIRNVFSFMLSQTIQILVHILKKELHQIDPTLYFTDDVVHATAYRLYVDEHGLVTKDRLVQEFLPKIVENVKRQKSSSTTPYEQPFSSSLSNISLFSPLRNHLPTANSKFVNQIHLAFVPILRANTANKYVGDEPNSIEEKLKDFLQSQFLLPSPVSTLVPLIAQQLKSVTNFRPTQDLGMYRNFVELSVGDRLTKYCSTKRCTDSSSSFLDDVIVVNEEQSFVQLKVDDLNLALSKFILMKLSPQQGLDNGTFVEEYMQPELSTSYHALSMVKSPSNTPFQPLHSPRGTLPSAFDKLSEKVPVFHAGFGPPSKSRNTKKEEKNLRSDQTQNANSVPPLMTKKFISYADWINIYPGFIQALHKVILEINMGYKKIQQLPYLAINDNKVQDVLRRLRRVDISGWSAPKESIADGFQKWQNLQIEVLTMMEEQRRLNRYNLGFDTESRWRCCICAGSFHECVICPYTSPHWM